MTPRLDKLRQKLAESQLNAILISQADNRRYLSGFTGSAGYLLISQARALLATDSRYVEQAKEQAPHFEIVRIEGELDKWFSKLMSELEAQRLGFESSDLSFSTYRRLTEALDQIQEQPQLIPTEGLVESLRAVKEEEELRLISKAIELTDAAFEHVSRGLQPGMTEKEVAWELEKYIRENGGEGVAFELIVASGPNSTLPHARPTERRLIEGEPVVIDIGAKVNSYCSDMTRTLCLGEPDETFKRIYDIVLGAQLTAIATLEVSMSGEQADRLARTVIEEAGHGEAFGHGLGHGLGLNIHEPPRLGKNSTDILSEGMVTTIEPGIYLPGWGGVRIEDVVVLEEGKAKVLSKASKIENPRRQK
jgi:Xaa-Pro aminopeptidase